MCSAAEVWHVGRDTASDAYCWNRSEPATRADGGFPQPECGSIFENRIWPDAEIIETPHVADGAKGPDL
jgi:hypothetical protein